jgi:hypothetical protein
MQPTIEQRLELLRKWCDVMIDKTIANNDVHFRDVYPYNAGDVSDHYLLVMDCWRPTLRKAGYDANHGWSKTGYKQVHNVQIRKTGSYNLQPFNEWVKTNNYASTI